MPHLESAALRRELREYFRLAWPIVVAQLSFVSMGTVDTILAGRLGAPQLAAVAVGANVFFLMYVFFLMFVFFSGLFMAVSPIVAQKIGAGRDVREIGSFVRGALVLALIMGCTWVVLQIGRASGRERGGRVGEISGGAEASK